MQYYGMILINEMLFIKDLKPTLNKQSDSTHGPRTVYHGGTPIWWLHTELYKLFCAERFDEYLKFGITHRPKTWRNVISNIAIFLTSFTE